MWSAYAVYFTLANRRTRIRYTVPQAKVPLREISKIQRLPVCAMAKQDQDYMHQWAIEHGNDDRYFLVLQNNNKYAERTLPLNMCRKELPVGDRVTEEINMHVLLILVNSCQQKCNSDPSADEDSTIHEVRLLFFGHFSFNRNNIKLRL